MKTPTRWTSTRRSSPACLLKWNTRSSKTWRSFPKDAAPCTTNPQRYRLLFIHTRTLAPSPLQRGLLFTRFLAFGRLFPVPAGRPAAEEPAEPASGWCGERDGPAERRRCSTALWAGRGAAESQRRVKSTGFRRPFPLYPYQRWGQLWWHVFQYFTGNIVIERIKKTTVQSDRLLISILFLIFATTKKR